MKFGEALEHVKAGRPVRRAQWPEDVILLLTHSAEPEPAAKPVLVIGKPWSFKGDDLLAEDWTLVEEK